MPALLINDYKAILRFYDIDYAHMKNKKIKTIAENALATKLCRCIKKVDPKDETKSIAICRDSVVRKKGLRISGFSCKKKPKLKKNSKTKKSLSKLGTKIVSKPARKRRRTKKNTSKR